LNPSCDSFNLLVTRHRSEAAEPPPMPKVDDCLETVNMLLNMVNKLLGGKIVKKILNKGIVRKLGLTE
jgi:hypothetical protein